MTPSGTEAVTFQLVAQYLNQPRHRVPPIIIIIIIIIINYTRKTFDRFTTKDSYTWNITHNTESTAV